jgi:hypothetical protein
MIYSIAECNCHKASNSKMQLCFLFASYNMQHNISVKHQTLSLTFGESLEKV